MSKTIISQCESAYKNAIVLAELESDKKMQLLNKISESLLIRSSEILSANMKDVEFGRKNGLTEALIDRLSLNQSRIEDISNSIIQISNLDDPIGNLLESWTQPNGLHIRKVRVPLGVIGMIYEARPNVTADALAIGIKTGNAIVLRGSASAYQSNLAIINVFKDCLETHGINIECIQLLEDTSRESVLKFIKMNNYLNLIIPRGGAGLINSVVENASVPTIETGVGNCHVYIDEFADIDQAIQITDNSKTQRPSVCNACETILIHKNIAETFLTQLHKIFTEKNVTVKGCEKTLKFYPSSQLANDSDWDTEYLDFIVSIRIVDSIDDAIQHIKKHGTLHTEAICSKNKNSIKLFQKLVDASTIMINASTRFTDGGEFGFGAEIGISTQKLHARGPMGIKELTSYKYIVEGSGQLK